MTITEKYLNATRLLEGISSTDFELGGRISIPASKILYMEEAFYLKDILSEENHLAPYLTPWLTDNFYLGTKIVFDKKYIYVRESLDDCLAQLKN